MTDVKGCFEVRRIVARRPGHAVSTDACTHNWVLTSLNTVSPLSKQTRAKISRRISRQRAQMHNVIRGAVIVISVVFAAVVLVAATK